MKILFFSYAYPNPANPGVGTFNRTMIAGLAKTNEVRVISPVSFVDAWKAWWQGRLPRGLNDATFQAVPDVRAEYCAWYYIPKLFRNLYGRFMQRCVGAVLNRTIREFQPDVVVSYWTHPDGEVAVKAAHQSGLCAVTIVGGSDVLIHARCGSRRKATLAVLEAADAVVTVSENIKNVLVADGIAASKVSVVRRGIDRNRFHEGNQSDARRKLGLPHNCPILISVGRLVEVKGHSYLIEACRLLAERGLQFKCYLIGDGPLRSELQQQIERSNLCGCVEVKGTCVPAELAEWYRAADLSVLASVSEGVPNVLLESIASGTPFVATNVGGIPEIADSIHDSLVPPSDSEALASAIAAQLGKSQNLKRNPRHFEPATADESAARLSAVLRRLVTGRTPQLEEPAIMHETMTLKDVTPESTVLQADEWDAVRGAPTCELSNSLTTALAMNSGHREMTPYASAVVALKERGWNEPSHAVGLERPTQQSQKLVMNVRSQVPRDVDELGRTGEGFYYVLDGHELSRSMENEESA